jgi:uncharacterized protein YgbK (DUF1537 family)
LEDQDAHSLAATALAWFDSLADPAAALIYSSADPARLAEIEARLGLARAASVLETAIGIVAEGVVRRGVRRIIAAGGETSGSIVAALGVAGGLIGSEAARGVPWIHTESGLALLLKSGNFGSADLLLEASA